MTDVAQGPGWWQASDGKWYPTQAPPPPGKPTKPIYKRVWFWVLLVIVVFFGGCVAIVAGTSKAVHDANTAKHTIIYSVTGSTGTIATVTYSAYDNGNQGTSQLSNQTLPWTKTITGSGLFNDYNLTATVGQNGGSVTCTLTVDGQQKASHTANGAFASANCSGSAS